MQPKHTICTRAQSHTKNDQKPAKSKKTQSHITSFIAFFCLTLIASVIFSGCGKMSGLDYEKFERIMAEDSKKSKKSRPTSFGKIRSEHIRENKPKRRANARQERQQERQMADLSQFSFSSSYAKPTTNEANAMLLNPFSSSSTFTLPQGLSPYYAEVIEDEMLPFPLERKKPARYKPTSHSELVSLVQNESIRLSEIDTSKITDMGFLFACNEAFLTCREDFRGIERWDTSKVVDMESMFDGNPFFNADISSWNVSKVRNMSKMFYNASKFNQSLSRWGDKIRADTKKHSMFLGSKLESNPPRWYYRR